MKKRRKKNIFIKRTKIQIKCVEKKMKRSNKQSKIAQHIAYENSFLTNVWQ